MNKKLGFTLIESLIYITCTTLLCLITASFLSNIYQYSTKNSQLVDRYFELMRAHDFMITYLKSAPINKSLWKKVETNNFVFQSNNIDYGFYIDSKKRLIKKTGAYDYKRQEWVSSGYSIIIDSVELEFIPEIEFKSGNFLGVNIKLKDIKINKNNKDNNTNLIISRFIKFYIGSKI